jgi:DNA polymerase III sliding clamp (beta) subunit (PCNA family)
MNRKTFLEKLEIVKPCLKYDSIVPIFGNVHIDKTFVESFNGVQGIKVDFGEEAFVEVCVKGDLISRLSETYSSDTLDLSVANDIFFLKDGKKAVAKLATTPVAEYISPFINKSKELTLIGLNEDVISGFEKCLGTSNKNKIQENQHGVIVVYDDKGLKLYSTDGKRISKFVTDIQPSVPPSNINVILPEQFCTLLVQQFKKSKAGDLSIGQNDVVGIFVGMEIYSKLHTNEEVGIPDFEKEMSKFDIANTKTIPIPDEFSKAVKRGTIIFDKGDKAIELSFKDKTLKVNGSSGICTIDEEIVLSESLGVSVFKIESELLSESLESITEIGIINTSNGNIILGKDGNYTALISTL